MSRKMPSYTRMVKPLFLKDREGEIMDSLHVLSINYRHSEANQTAFIEIVNSLGYLLPDLEYRKIYVEGLAKIPLSKTHFSSQENLFQWSVRLRSFINLNLGRVPPRINPVVFSQGKMFWGPKIWASFHILAANYKPSAENRKAFINFVSSMAYILPCDECRQHYIKNLSVIPLREKYFLSPESLYQWTFKLHSLVNSQLGKIEMDYRTSKKIWFGR